MFNVPLKFLENISSIQDNKLIQIFYLLILLNSCIYPLYISAYIYSISHAVGSRQTFRSANASSLYHAQRTIQSKCQSDANPIAIHLLIKPVECSGGPN